ncbi:MAG TPA: DUF167 domain-containing protein [Spirochaetota bacterium]|jgi:hypothetical protein|nr:DUF167 domain-containing protein [Spirochaetota bacterium]HOH36905.1 DUF167 domain-containing protein [Spirochaetota bacterium]HPY02948.1 DUF167 domain-containing protein [Spirochaetota bacterium]
MSGLFCIDIQPFLSLNDRSMEFALIEVSVQPKSSKSIIVKTETGLKAYLNSPPVDGKANAECIRLFSETLKIAKSRISVIKGEKSKKKILRIEGISKDAAYSILLG